MPRVKKVYGPTVIVVGKSRNPPPEVVPISPEMESKLAVLRAVLANGEKHGLDRLDELHRIQAEIEELKLKNRPNPREKET